MSDNKINELVAPQLEADAQASSIRAQMVSDLAAYLMRFEPFRTVPSEDVDAAAESAVTLIEGRELLRAQVAVQEQAVAMTLEAARDKRSAEEVEEAQA